MRADIHAQADTGALEHTYPQTQKHTHTHTYTQWLEADPVCGGVQI